MVLETGNLTTKRDYTDVRDIAKAYRLLIEKGKSGETYNVCTGRSISGNDILTAIQKITKTTITPKVDKNKIRPNDIKDIYGDNQKITTDTGWLPSIDLNKTLTDVINTT